MGEILLTAAEWRKWARPQITLTDAQWSKIQRELDDYAYPPTHEYDVRTLTPQGVLAERVGLLLKLCPKFFEAVRFLDVGANKGFFSLLAARSCAEVVAVEPSAVALDLWDYAALLPSNVRQLCSSFDALSSKDIGTFDMVWVGNGHHYLHRDNPWQWLSQLALLATERLVIEGPTGPSAKGFEDWPLGTVPIEQVWVAEAERHGLYLQGRVDSPKYTPGRALWYLRRKMR